MTNLPNKLFHYSKSEVTELKDSFYVNHKKHWPEEASMKPVGLWLSVEDDLEDAHWKDWCVREQFRVDSLKYKYKVNISKKARILHLKTEEEIAQFSVEYRGNFQDLFQFSDSYICWINWLKVQHKYDGIIISPYQWASRLASNCAWYYSWDCASGCIWNLNKVNLKLDEIIDVESLMVPERQEEESSTDSLLANLVLSA